MDHFTKALILKYESQKATAIAELSVLLQSPIGIGEHTNIIDEMDSKIHKIAQAEECLKIAQQLNSQPSPQPSTQET